MAIRVAGIPNDLPGCNFVYIDISEIESNDQENTTVDAEYDPQIVEFYRTIEFFCDWVWGKDKQILCDAIYDKNTLICRHYPGFKRLGKVQWQDKFGPNFGLYTGRIVFLKKAKTSEELIV